MLIGIELAPAGRMTRQLPAAAKASFLLLSFPMSILSRSITVHSRLTWAETTPRWLSVLDNEQKDVIGQVVKVTGVLVQKWYPLH